MRKERRFKYEDQREKNKKWKLVLVFVLIFGFIVIDTIGDIFFSDHTKFVQHILEHNYKTTFIMKNKRSLNGTTWQEQYQFIPIDNENIIVTAIYYKGVNFDSSQLIPEFFVERSSDNFQEQIKQYVIHKTLNDQPIDLSNHDIKAFQLIYDMQTEINNLLQKYNITPTQYSCGIELKVLKDSKIKNMNFGAHDINIIERVLAEE